MNLPIPPRPDTGTAFDVTPPGPDGRIRSTWGWWEGVGVFVLASLVGGIVAIPVLARFGNTSVHGAVGLSEILQGIVGDVVTVGILVAWLGRWHKEWRASIVGPRPKARIVWNVVVGFGAGLLLIPAVGLISVLIQNGLKGVVGHDVSVPAQVAPDLSSTGRVLLVFFACVVAPVTEEFFFRGVLFRTVRDRHGFWFAATASAIPFGLLHWIIGSPTIDAVALVLTMVFTGLGLAWIYERRGTIVASMAAHVAFNVIGVVTILAIAR
jgi:membrane protease YdiL (CAAX protease family)